MAKKKQTFEDSMNALEEIVKEMESGRLTLEEAVNKYETGMKYSKLCLDILDKTEKKITLLRSDDSGNLIEEPFKNE